MSGPADAASVNRAELAALDHAEPHLYEGQCGCSCPECVTPIGRCVCLDCGCS